MKLKSIKLLSCLFALGLLSLTTYSCTEDDGGVITDFIYPTVSDQGNTEPEEDATDIESIKVSPESSTLSKESAGSSILLSASITPKTTIVKSIEWSSSVEGVVTITPDSLTCFVKAVEYGTTIVSVIVTDESGNEMSAQSEITVAPDYVGVTSLTITNTEDTELFVYNAGVGMEAYGKKQLEWEFNKFYLSPILEDGVEFEDLTDAQIEELLYEWLPSEEVTVPTVQNLTWFSANVEVVTVQGGELTAIGVGEALVYATSIDNPVVVDSCLVKVYEAKVRGISSIFVADEDICQGEATQLTANIEPVYATFRDCTWEIITGGDYASVNDNGLLTAKEVSTTQSNDVVVKVTSIKNSSATCEMTISIAPAAVTAVDIIAADTEIFIGEEISLSSSLTPVYAGGDTTLTWKSSDESVATVDESGKVTGVAIGDVTITAKSANGVESNSIAFVVTESIRG